MSTCTSSHKTRPSRQCCVLSGLKGKNSPNCKICRLFESAHWSTTFKAFVKLPQMPLVSWCPVPNLRMGHAKLLRRFVGQWPHRGRWTIDPPNVTKCYIFYISFSPHWSPLSCRFGPPSAPRPYQFPPKLCQLPPNSLRSPVGTRRG